MEISEVELPALRRKLRFKVCHHVGFACPDVDDIVQESIVRLLRAAQSGKMLKCESVGPFLNGIAQNVIQEYRRRWTRDGAMPETVPDSADQRAMHSEVYELHDAIVSGIQQLSPRDREILKAYYFEERPKSEILANLGLTDETFRVILCRAKERFRKIYTSSLQHKARGTHT